MGYSQANLSLLHSSSENCPAAEQALKEQKAMLDQENEK